MSDQISTFDGSETVTEAPLSPAPSKRARTSSAAAKLLQAAALATVLVPLGSIAAEGSTISCSYTADGSGGATFDCPTGPNGGALFQFGDTSPFKYVCGIGIR